MLLIIAVAAFLAAIAVPDIVHPFEALELDSFLPLHTLMELFAVGVAVLIFATGWHTHGGDRPGNIVILACGFLGVALLDTVHTLSYKGMPSFVTPSGVEKAIFFWLAARLLSTATLLAVAVRQWRLPYRTPIMASWPAASPTPRCVVGWASTISTGYRRPSGKAAA